MQIYLSFKEISAYIKEHYGKELEITKISDKELNVSLIANLGSIVKVKPAIKLKIVDVKDDEVTVKYHVGFIVDSVLGSALPTLLKKFQDLSKGIHVEPDNCIRINLSEIEKTKPIIEKISISDITIEDNSILLSLSIK